MKTTTTTADGPTFRAVSNILGRTVLPQLRWDITRDASRAVYDDGTAGEWTPHTAEMIAAIAAENAQAASGQGGVIY
jgi:hypothetical protein